MLCRTTGKIVNDQICNACWGDTMNGKGGGWHRLCRKHNLVDCSTILERLWEIDPETVLRLTALGLLLESTVRDIIGVDLLKAECSTRRVVYG